MKKSKIIGLGIAIFFLFISCPNPGMAISEPTILIDPPVLTSASIIGSYVSLSWIGRDSDESYRVYRKSGNGSYIQIAEVPKTVQTFNDQNGPLDSDLLYGIKAVSKKFESPLSNVSTILNINSAEVVVPNVRATVFEYNNKIKISWDKLAFADSYEIYKHVDKEIDPNKIGETDKLFFDNVDTDLDPPIKDKAIFYSVHWSGQGKSGGTSGSIVQGIYSSEVDVFEYNNSKEKASIMSFKSTINSLTYSSADGSGSFVSDEDWYVTQVPANGKIYINIKFPIGSTMTTGDLLSQCFYNDKSIDTDTISTSPYPQFSPIVSGVQGELESVYIRVFSAEGKNFTTEYSISISDSF